MGLFRKKPLDFDMVTTRGGDNGKTSLYSGEFVFKSESVFDVLGEIDLLSSEMGWGIPHEFQEMIEHIQYDLYTIMSVLATSSKHENYPGVTEKSIPIDYLERLMKRLMKRVDIEPNFVLPSSRFDVLRARARNAERALIKYVQDIKKVIPVEYSDLHHCQRYLNRLSDLFFVLARWEEQHLKKEKTKFHGELEEID